MLATNIVLFAKKYLETHSTVNAKALQDFIYERPEVGKKLPISELEKALEWGYLHYELEITFANDSITIYCLPKRG